MNNVRRKLYFTSILFMRFIFKLMGGLVLLITIFFFFNWNGYNLY
jgi:hypothetical protein